jgi:hypothetical protein
VLDPNELGDYFFKRELTSGSLEGRDYDDQVDKRTVSFNRSSVFFSDLGAMNALQMFSSQSTTNCCASAFIRVCSESTGSLNSYFFTKDTYPEGYGTCDERENLVFVITPA